MDTPDVSVVVTVQGHDESLPTCLAHLEQQSFPAARFEILVVDDASNDDTSGLLERYAEGAPVRVRRVPALEPAFAAAANRAIHDAHGAHVVFLRADLLASPNLVERHLATLDAPDVPFCSVGAVERHPHLPPGALTPYFLPEDQCPTNEGAALGHLDWRVDNFACARVALIDAGGFDASLPFPEFEASALAKKLETSNQRGRYTPEAVGYVWQAETLAHARNRQYARGYCLHAIRARTRDAEIERRFRMRRSRPRALYERMIQPFYIKACEGHEGDAQEIAHIYGRVLRNDRCRGFADAAAQRPPRPLAPAGNGEHISSLRV